MSVAAVTEFVWKVTVTVTDVATELGVSGALVELRGDAKLSFAETFGTTNGSGVFSTTASTAARDIGTMLLSASTQYGAEGISSSTYLTLEPASVIVEAAATNLAMNDSTTVTAKVFSAFGTPMSDIHVEFSANGVTPGQYGNDDRLAAASFTSPSGSTGSRGEYSTTASTVNGGGGVWVVAKAGQASGGCLLTVVDPRIVISGVPATARPGEAIQVTVRRSDDAGAPVSRKVFAYWAGPGGTWSLRADSAIKSSGTGSQRTFDTVAPKATGLLQFFVLSSVESGTRVSGVLYAAAFITVAAQ